VERLQIDRRPRLERDALIKHLELIQGVINRQAQNAFAVKGWSITVAAAILTFLLSQDSTRQLPNSILLVVLLPTLGFWYLDAYYLRQERIFRLLYSAVRDDYDRADGAAALIEPFDMDTTIYKPRVCLIRLMFTSPSVRTVPLIIILTGSVLLLIGAL